MTSEAPLSSHAGVGVKGVGVESVRKADEGAELSRGLAGLYIKGADRPYALRATLQRATLLYAVGRYGALVESQLGRRAMGEVEARVGAPA